MSALTSHLLGNTRTAVLGALLLRPDDRLHVRELARVTGISAGTLHRELTALAALEVLTRRVEGRQVYYAANRANPVFEELAGLLRKTAGLVDVLRDALISYRERITAAFMYGSLAAGTETSRSDVDLMIIGDVGFAEAVRALAPAESILRREVNPTVMKRADFLRKRKARDAFIATVWKAPKLWVIGDAGELG
jgi:predicted nucleotidyltransferase